MHKIKDYEFYSSPADETLNVSCYKQYQFMGNIGMKSECRNVVDRERLFDFVVEKV